MTHYVAVGEIDWTETRMARLRALHALSADERLSFDAIAAQLTQEFGMTVSKNACIGKARRMKLVRRAYGPIPQRKRKRATAAPAPTPAPAYIAPEAVPCVRPRWKAMEVPRPAPGGRITLFQLNGNTCRWPHGDRTPYLFCGATTAGKTYCAYHTGISCGRLLQHDREQV